VYVAALHFVLDRVVDIEALNFNGGGARQQGRTVGPGRRFFGRRAGKRRPYM